MGWLSWVSTAPSWSWSPSYRPGAGMCWSELNLVPRFDVQHGHPRPCELLQLGRRAVESREGAEVHRDHGLHAEQLHRLCGPPGTHRVEVAHRQEGNLGLVQLFDERHVAEHVGIAREVDLEAVFELDDVAHWFPGRGTVRRGREVFGVHHREADPVDLHGAALAEGDHILDALLGQPGADLERGQHLRVGRLGYLHRVRHVVAVAVSDQHDVKAVDRLEVIGRNRVGRHPRVDQHVLATGGADLPRAVPNPGELDLIVDGHLIASFEWWAASKT